MVAYLRPQPACEHALLHPPHICLSTRSLFQQSIFVFTCPCRRHSSPQASHLPQGPGANTTSNNVLCPRLRKCGCNDPARYQAFVAAAEFLSAG
ncbi:hypothetical protein XANCAGTX0491_010044 [Xanthoria calcicola]